MRSAHINCKAVAREAHWERLQHFRATEANRVNHGVCIRRLDSDELLRLPAVKLGRGNYTERESDQTAKEKFHCNRSDVTRRLVIQFVLLLAVTCQALAQLPPRPIDGKLGLQDERGRMILDERGRHILPDKAPHYIVGGGGVVPNPVEYWTLDAPAGQSRTGTIHHVLLTETFGGPVANTAGLITNALHCSGPNSGIQTGSNAAAYNYPELALTTNSFSLCGWMFLESTPSPPSALFPFDWHFCDLSGTSTEPVTIKFINSPPLSFNVQARANSYFGAIPITLSNWFFFRIWWSDSDSKCRVSINDGTAAVDASTSPFPQTLAGYVDFFAQQNGFRFAADEFGLWEPALTDDQATALYNQGAGRTFP